MEFSKSYLELEINNQKEHLIKLNFFNQENLIFGNFKTIPEIGDLESIEGGGLMVVNRRQQQMQVRYLKLEGPNNGITQREQGRNQQIDDQRVATGEQVTAEEGRRKY